MKSHRISLIIFVSSLLFLMGCGSINYYNSIVVNSDASGDETYIELQLLKDGSFREYIYYGLNDSLDNSDEGILISGYYYQHKDTLFLTYSNALKILEYPDSSLYRETYIITNDGLELLEPITYSYHLMNRKMVIGQSAKMRSLPHYSAINWIAE